MLKETIEKCINNNYDIASSEIGISDIVLKEFVRGNAKISIVELERILNVLNIIIDDKKSKTIEKSLIVKQEEKKDTLKWYIAYWLKKKEFEVKKSTYCNYANLIKNQIIPTIGDIKFKELNKDILQFFIYQVQTKNNLSEKTTKDCIGIIRQILEDGQDEGIIPQFIISRRRLKYKKQILLGNKKQTYSESEYKKIIQEVINKIDHTKLGILLGIYTGMRIGELCALQFKDIDFERKEIQVNKTLQRIYDPTNDIEPSKIVISTPKTETSIRKIPITNNIAKILKTLKTENEDYVLTGKSKYTEPRTFRRKYTAFMNSIGIEPLKFHSLRHTFASINIENGNDIKTISEILGHSNIDVTLKVYTHSSEKAKIKAVDKFNKIFSKEKKIEKFNKKYKGNICCINKKTGKLDFLGTIKEVSEYIDNFATHVVNCINTIEDDEVYYIVPEIEGITHKNGVYMGG